MDVGAQDATEPVLDDVTTGQGDVVVGVGVSDGGPVDAIAPLLAALEGADDLSLDDRLHLLRDAEAGIAGVLEGLDGL
jgi:hypothetical protein